jgi:hypothetical protein
MRRPDDEPLALERLEASAPPQLPDAAGEPGDTDELRAELSSLEARLASYPTGLAEELERVRAERTRAEGALERAEARLAQLAPEHEGEKSRWWRRTKPPADPALGVEHYNRDTAAEKIATATEQDRELAPQVPDRRQWETEHAPLRERTAEIRTELGTRRERHVERAIESPTTEIVEALGERPRDERPRAEWDRGARAIAGYRYEHAPTGQGPLGDERHDRAGARDRQAAGRELERAQHALGRGREQHGHDLGLV